jgi:hypothetical protein
MDLITAFCSSNDKLPMILALGMLVLFFFLYKAQRAPDNFDLRDLMRDPRSKRVSLPKTATLTALIMSSWGCVYLTLHNQLNETYFTTFMAAWVVGNLGHNAINSFGHRPVDTLDKEDDKDDNGKEKREDGK